MFSMLSGKTKKATTKDDELYNFDKKIPLSKTDGILSNFGAPNTGKHMTGVAGDTRPMTSVRAAGYSSRGRTSGGSAAAFDPFNQAGMHLYFINSIGRSSQEKITLVPEIKDLERKVHQVIHESCIASSSGNYRLALEKAKEAGKKERQIARERENANSGDQMNLDLTYCVLFNLANQYSANKLYQEALNTYAVIVKNKAFNNSGRLRVNMGNIYFEQKNYSQAIKMYRMALDQIPSTSKEIRLKILRNIGIASVKMELFQDAVPSFEAIVQEGTDCIAGFNLVLCYFALGDKERMKKGFLKLLSIKLPVIDKFEEIISTSKDGSILDQDVFNQDSLRDISREKRKAIERFILLAAKLLAPVIGESFSTGYDWIVDAIKASPHVDIASELEISKSIQYLKKKEFTLAIDSLKSFENQDQKFVGAAATNLSFLYFLDGDYKQSENYADIAITHDRYNSKGHTNRGNSYFQNGDFENAQKHYEEAIGLDALSIEAMFNLALLYKKTEKYKLALKWFEKLHAILTNSAQVIFQIADIHDKCGNLSSALEWFNILISVVPTDPGVLARLGSMFERDGDKAQAFQYYSESFRYFPSNLDVISWLGAYYVDNKAYEQAISFFERAILIEPNESKWQLLIAGCYRQSGNYQSAFDSYKIIHETFPDSIECLRYLVRISTDLGMASAVEYGKKLSKTETGRQEQESESFINEKIKSVTFSKPKMEPELDYKDDITGLLPE